MYFILRQVGFRMPKQYWGKVKDVFKTIIPTATVPSKPTTNRCNVTRAPAAAELCSQSWARFGNSNFRDNRQFAVKGGVIRCSPRGWGLWNVSGSQNSSACAKASTLPSYQTQKLDPWSSLPSIALQCSLRPLRPTEQRHIRRSPYM